MRGTTRALSAAAFALGALVMGGCSHTWYQFEVSQVERSHIDATKNALAATQANPNALAQVVDLEGRRGAEALIAGMSVQSNQGDAQVERLSRVLYLAIMGDAEDPLAALDQDMTMAGARVAQRIAQGGLNQMGLGGLAAMVGVVGDDDGQRLREMSVSLQRGQPQTCGPFDVIVSYDAGILGHIHTSITDNDATYQAWKQRVQAVHLVRFTCATNHMLVVMTRNRGEAGLRVIGWHFVTQAQWESMRPGLRHAFDLPQ
ncbi:MAG: hypothetical protein RLO52_47090 [Sandaracinaceae bacterium]